VKQAIVDALLNEDRRYIAMATAGVLFFGTPHRGIKEASWARLMAWIGEKAGFDSHDGIIKDLEENSINQIDLLHHFTCWLRRMSVEVVCIIELKKTDYGRKAGLPAIRPEFVSRSLVGEK
jgi:hypothetical protein